MDGGVTEVDMTVASGALIEWWVFWLKYVNLFWILD